MKVRDVMETDVVTVPETATYEEVARLLYERNVSGFPVVNTDGRVIGAVSEKDLLRIMFPYYRSYYINPESYTNFEAREDKFDDIRSHPVSRFMSREVLCVEPGSPIMRAGAIMLAHNLNRLPVIDNGTLVGAVSRSTIYREILKHHLPIT